MFLQNHSMISQQQDGKHLLVGKKWNKTVIAISYFQRLEQNQNQKSLSNILLKY